MATKALEHLLYAAHFEPGSKAWGTPRILKHVKVHELPGDKGMELHEMLSEAELLDSLIAKRKFGKPAIPVVLVIDSRACTGYGYVVVDENTLKRHVKRLSIRV